MDTEIRVVDVPERSRYEALSATGELMGFSNYRLSDGTIAFTHAETLPDFRGQGVAATVAAKSLEAARQAGLRVKPACPYYQEFIADHPQYADLVGDTR
jgi:uncharacterized protein